MQRRVFLHIGMGRCGSRAIQSLLVQNRGALLQRGFDYPTPAELGVNTRHGGNVTAIAQQLRNDEDTAKRTALIARMCARVADSKVDSCILSSEFLYPRSSQTFADIRDAFGKIGCKPHVVVYIREQREWLISWFAQKVKQSRYTGGLQEFMMISYKGRKLDYASWFAKLRDVFGRENITIRVFDRDRLIERDVRRDFLHVIGCRDDGLELADTDQNVSGSLAQIILMQMVNARAENGSFYFRNEDFLKATHDASDGGKDLYRLVDPKLMAKMGRRFAQKNELFRLEFLPDVPGPLFRSRIPLEYTQLFPEQIDSRELIDLLSRYVEEFVRRREKREKARRSVKASVLQATTAPQ